MNIHAKSVNFAKPAILCEYMLVCMHFTFWRKHYCMEWLVKNEFKRNTCQKPSEKKIIID